MDPKIPAPPELSEAEFAELVDAIAADPRRGDALPDLLREEHPVYQQRNLGEILRMRGWVLIALARTGVTERELPFILEEFDAGTDAYLVGAAAYALRTYKHPGSSFAPYVIRALINVREEPLSFESYGDDATSPTSTSLVRELFAVLRWLGPHACATSPQLAAMRAQPGRFSKKLLIELDRTIEAIAPDIPDLPEETDSCCLLSEWLGQRCWSPEAREPAGSVHSVVFEDQDGQEVLLRDFFRELPTIIVFFYTRCDNPWKCSLTVTKLARVQNLLRERGMARQIRTVAITYDPAFDLSDRLRAYGTDRGLAFDSHHRMLRSDQGFAALNEYFNLGVNFVESLVNRHRIELYILDGSGRVAASFERLHWVESQVVDRAMEVLREGMAHSRTAPPSKVSVPRTASTFIGTLASICWAFLPKCPACWAAYVSAFGVAGIRPIQSSSVVLPALAAIMLINIVSVWLRARATRRMAGFYVACAGVMTISLARMDLVWEQAATLGILLISAGSLWNAMSGRQLRNCWRRLKLQSSEIYFTVKLRMSEGFRRQGPYPSLIHRPKELQLVLSPRTDHRTT